MLSINFAYAATVYKIVDENGKVTYSQFPPKSHESKGKQVKDIRLNASQAPMTRISNVNGDLYCGDIHLPKQYSYRNNSIKYFIKNVTSSKQSWQASLDRLGESMEKSRQRQINSTKNNGKSIDRYGYSRQSKRDARFNENYKKDIKRMRDLRCAINWASETQESILSHSEEDNKERDRLRGVYATLNKDLQKHCGKQPLLDPTDRLNERHRKRWYDCSKSYLSDMKKVQRQLDRL